MSKERRLVALCTSAHLRSWIEAEISDLVTARFYAASVPELIALVSRGGASQSELLVLDLDLLSTALTVELETGLQDRWWDGTIVGLGALRAVHRRHLSIERTIDRPLGSETLRAYVERTEGSDTAPIVDWPQRLARKRS
ncbi:MAG: hypothetical protein JO257_32330 [Deltaproteobacteria bacterium]|nr:hypothetical protein [Deltaproteobacteria bacterium]